MRNGWMLFLGAALCAGCAGRGSGPDIPPAELVGTWSCDASVRDESEGAAEDQRRDIVITIDIADDGMVTGAVGDATLDGCMYQCNRGALGRRLNIQSDHIIRNGSIVGAIYAGDPVAERSFTLPCNLVEGQLRGTIMVLEDWKYPKPLTR